MKQPILIASLAKVKENAPWRVGIYIEGEYTFFTVGSNGNVAMSPRFHSFITAVEKKVSRYPVDISFHSMDQNREMEATTLREQIVYVDCGINALRLIKNAAYYYEKEVKGNPLEVKRKQATMSEDVLSVFEVSENIASTTLDYIGIGEVIKVIDGDTITVKMNYLSHFLEGFLVLENHLNEEDEYKIRFNGVDSAEKHPDNNEVDPYKEKKNAEFGKSWGVTKDDMYSIADEAYKFTTSLLGGGKSANPLVIIHFDRETDGGRPMLDDYGRHIADLYATSDKTPEIIMDKLKDETKKTDFVHINKTLLTTYSKKFTHIPFGFFNFQYANGTSMLNPMDWVAELDLKTVDPDSQFKLPEIEDESAPDIGDYNDIYEEQINTDSVEFSTNVTPDKNNLDFFSPYDDRLSVFAKGIKTVEDLKKHSKVRIGDVIMTIPPLSIEVNKTANISKIKTLRTKSSVLVNRGQSVTTLTMDLYFHDLDSINGKKTPWKKDSENFFLVDGLRPLLAQFAKAPFVPIDNYYINDTLGIRDVALLDIEVTTVPNFPESISARLTLVEFNSEAYLMEQSSLGDSINYPMLRWYYNQSLVDRGSKYRFFKELEGPMKSDLKFSLAEETYLIERKEAINFLKNSDSPETIRTEMKTKNPSYKNKEEDAGRVSDVVSQYDRYKKMNIKKHTVIDYFTDPMRDKPSLDVLGALIDTYNVKKETAENAVVEANELFSTLYDNRFENKYSTLVHEEGIFLPYEGRVFYKKRFDYNWLENAFIDYDEKPPVDYDEAPYKGTEKNGLIIVNQMKDTDNQAKLEKKYADYFKDKQFFLPASEDVISVLKEIAKGPEDMEVSIDEYEKEFNAMVNIVNASESEVRLKEFEIPGGIIPISMNARFTNEFSMAHVISGEAPTLQYMGGGDGILEMSLEVTEEGAKAFNKLIAESDRYAKFYNQGITNGYIGIENDLSALFGITHIMFESISVNTIPGFPGRYSVMLKAINFDKTQRQREELTALPGNSKHMDLDMLVANKNAFANDRMIESRLHRLEVYPDMELPTYNQINEVLPDMDTGGCDGYINLSGGTFLDPDFYFSTVSTLRGLIDDEYGQEHKLDMFDAVGIKAYTSNTLKDKLFDTTAEDWAKLKAIEETDGVEPLGWLFKWAEENDVELEDATEVKEVEEKPLSEAEGELGVQNAEIKTFLQGEEYKKFPSKEEWQKLYGSSYSYEDFASKPNPDEVTIYKKLSDLVDAYFGEYYSYKNFIEECRGDLSEADVSKKKLSYLSPDDLAGANWHYKVSKMGVENLNFHAMTKINELKEPENVSKNVKVLKKSKGKVTKERFVTLMKAFLDGASGWKQYTGNAPTVSKTGRIGIAMVDISTEDATLEETKRLLYNWEYNLDKAIGQLANHYETARNPKNADLLKFTDWEAHIRPWDVMFALYADPSLKIKKASDLQKNKVVATVLSKFAKYAYKPFNTFSGFNPEIFKAFAGMTKDEEKALKMGTKDEYVTSLLDLEFYDLEVFKKNNLTVDSDKSNIKKAMKEYLNEFSAEILKSYYQNHLKYLYVIKTKASKISNAEKKVDAIADWVGVFVPGTDLITDLIPEDKLYFDYEDDNGYTYSPEIYKKGAKLYEAMRAIDSAAENAGMETDTRLYNDVDPRTLYEEMFYDMRAYDQRGRMVRAFPGFQMFIIHEGDYFGKYKFWDNLYGFNALESIDIHRSRKIAADTAVISMTNVYSNLTTRRTDIDYVDRQMKWWDNYVWNELPQDLIDKKANETHRNIFLETGARIHLRMGYGATASSLPIVFNGTITELEMGDVINVVAQGDGLELGNPISGDPDDDNDGIFKVTEPRDTICKMLASKGSWTKDFLNKVSEHKLFERNPLGISHFGQPFDTSDSTASMPLGTLLWYNDEYGEVAQNIYSSNGTPTFSQWLHPNGERNNIFDDFTWKRLWENKMKILNPGDERNLVMSMYNNTAWDIIQTIALSSPDYIAAVHPFELRSTLFFGKPWWRASFQYDSRYEFDAQNKSWARHLVAEARRPYMQHKFYTSYYDIISNNIKASEETMFTNVIVNYDGKQTPVLYADADIRFDKQKTRVIDGNITAKFGDFYTSEVMATFYGNSVLRDAMKDMYQGSLVVMGDPTVKPHDMMAIVDDINDLNGNALVKSVTHHFSRETGFITSIEPDLVVANDDPMLLEMSKWYFSFASSLAATLAVKAVANKAAKGVVSWMTKDDILPKSIGKWVATKGFKETLKMADDGSKEMKDVMKIVDEILKDGEKDVTALRKKLGELLEVADKAMDKKAGIKAGAKYAARKTAIKSGRTFAHLLTYSDDVAKISLTGLNAARKIASLTVVGAIVNVAIWIGTEMLFEHYRRFKENLQCVVALPLTYRGQELTAGINGHAGMIYGDAPGKYDRMYDAALFYDDGEDEFFGNVFIELANFFTGSGGQYRDAGTLGDTNTIYYPELDE